MMKKYVLAALAACSISLANAAPIGFHIADSSLSATGSGLAVSYYQDFSPHSFVLDDGQSKAVNFGAVTVQGAVDGTLELTLDFDAPVDTDVTGAGTFSIKAFLFLVNDELTWNEDVVVPYVYNGYAGNFTIAFNDIAQDGWELELPLWKLSGVITNNGSVAVPEPATLALLGLGLVGLGAARRRQGT